jgi:DNA (cytosine-5)-methyltransferase 1
LTYVANFHELPHADVRDLDTELIPDHDLLLAGFPCQPFSVAGVSKKNSLHRPHGFADETQGNLFFELARIVAAKRPAAFLFENVKNLKSHDGGRTYQVIMDTLRKKLGYHVYDTIVDARHFVPQHRERVFIVGFRDDVPFSFPLISGSCPTLGSILEDNVDPKYTLTDHLWQYLQEYARKHRERGNGFGFGLFGPDDIARTLSARYYKDGSEILIRQNKARNPRRLTPRECASLMGFPKDYRIVVSDTQAYKQFGNAVVVPAVQVISRRMLICMAQAGIIKSDIVRRERSRNGSVNGGKVILPPSPGVLPLIASTPS